MSRRDGTQRCAACLMHETLCLCAELPRIEARTRLALLVHHTEARKPTNTGTLAARCLAGATVDFVGDLARPVRQPIVGDGELGVLLYPADDAAPITEIAAALPADARVVLVVPDGNWRQAARMRGRVPGLSELRCATLPAGSTAPTSYRLRHEHRDDGMATLEAIAHALRALEGPRGDAVADALLAIFQTMVERTLWLRGAIPTSAVTSGVPAAALARDPRGAVDKRRGAP